MERLMVAKRRISIRDVHSSRLCDARGSTKYLVEITALGRTALVLIEGFDK
jgi:hypothetical protein